MPIKPLAAVSYSHSGPFQGTTTTAAAYRNSYCSWDATVLDVRNTTIFNPCEVYIAFLVV